MDSEIHGAIVGGALAGVTVVVGVSVEAWASRVRDRRQALETVAASLVYDVMRVVYPISEGWAGDRPEIGIESNWQHGREKVEHGLLTIMRQARWPLWRARPIKRSASRTYEHFVRLTSRWETAGTYVSTAELEGFWPMDEVALIFRSEDPMLGPEAPEVQVPGP